MRLSLKNMLISFVAALVVFSVIMTVVCVAIYRSKIPVRTKEDGEAVSAVLPARQGRYEFSETQLCYLESGTLRFAVLIGVSEQDRTIAVTPISGTLPVNYKNGIYYVSTVYQSEGAESLSALAEALTGISADTLFSADFLSVPPADTMEGFAEQMTDRVLARYEGYTVNRIEVLLDGNGVADNDKTMEQFFITE